MKSKTSKSKTKKKKSFSQKLIMEMNTESQSDILCLSDADDEDTVVFKTSAKSRKAK